MPRRQFGCAEGSAPMDPRPVFAWFLLATVTISGACNDDRGAGAAPDVVDMPDASTAGGSGADRPRAEAERTTVPAEPGSPAAAVAVIHDYYLAIAERDYARAYAAWAAGGAASGQTFDEFRRGYAETASVDADIGEPGRRPARRRDGSRAGRGRPVAHS